MNRPPPKLVSTVPGRLEFVSYILFHFSFRALQREQRHLSELKIKLMSDLRNVDEALQAVHQELVKLSTATIPRYDSHYY